jgi:hypothetical protein
VHLLWINSLSILNFHSLFHLSCFAKKFNDLFYLHFLKVWLIDLYYFNCPSFGLKGKSFNLPCLNISIVIKQSQFIRIRKSLIFRNIGLKILIPFEQVTKIHLPKLFRFILPSMVFNMIKWS